MSIKTKSSTAEGAMEGVPADSKAGKPESMETKEEKRARKAAKKAAKETATETSIQVTPASAEAGPSTLPATSPDGGAEETPSASEKKTKKDKKRRRAAEETTGPATAAAPTEGAEASASTPAEADPQEEKRARKLARKAVSYLFTAAWVRADVSKQKAAARSAAAGGPPPEIAEPNIEIEAVPTGEAAGPVLSEPAKKALTYVDSYAATHLNEGPTPAPGKGWKFNKANQNWLIRNVWNESEVPEEHVDAVMRYLNTIKGGGRTALIEMAEKCSAASTEPPAVTEEAAAPVEANAAASAETKAAAALSPAAAAATPVISPEEAKRDRETIKARAEKLLVLLRA